MSPASYRTAPPRDAALKLTCLTVIWQERVSVVAGYAVGLNDMCVPLGTAQERLRTPDVGSNTCGVFADGSVFSLFYP